MTFLFVSLEAIDAQNHLDEIQGVRGIYFAGAWCGYGFHEDGIKSALRVADLLHAQIPWNPRTTSPKMNLGDYFYMRLFNTYAKSAIIRGSLRIILPNGDELVYGNGETKHDGEASKLLSTHILIVGTAYHAHWVALSPLFQIENYDQHITGSAFS